MSKLTMSAFVACGLICGSIAAHAAERDGYRLATPEEAALAGLPAGSETWVYDGSTAGEPQSYFGTQPVQVSFLGNQFQPRISSLQYGTTGVGGMVWESGDNFADAQLHLPSGVILDGGRWWARDSVAQDALFFFFSVCQPVNGPGAPTNISVAAGGTNGTGGEQSGTFTLPSIVVDNNTCSYFFRINFAGGVGIALHKVRITWHRQVSPAPATATFGDVPTTHPFFRFVEALADAGITGGCGGGNYCPNSNLTRGEMAVFLSVALGLHFPN